ncbi:MAG: N-acetylmuramic acid 6-phosphate etherase [Prolixibacteraceae bacterium]
MNEKYKEHTIRVEVRITEKESNYRDLDKMSAGEILKNINNEDQTVAFAVEKCIPQLEKLVMVTVENMRKGGRLFYLGAGTSGRLGVLDASECPPTFGVPSDRVIGIIAGGDTAFRNAVEFAEDKPEQGWNDLEQHNVRQHDIVVGITASGYAPYVLGAITEANRQGITTACIVCNTGTQLAAEADYPIEVVVGPEFISGSTRMKSGTAQKMVLNMLTTSVMIQLGRVKGNKMVDMQLMNKKLLNRGVRMIMDETDLDEQTAMELLIQQGSVRKAIEHVKP